MTESPVFRRVDTAAPAAVVLAAGAIVLAVVVRDPHADGSWAQCPTLWLTGLLCPGCGSLRALHDLGTGDLAAGIRHNPLLVPALCWLGWAWIAWTARVRGALFPTAPQGRLFCWMVLAATTAYTVARNLPGAPLGP